ITSGHIRRLDTVCGEKFTHSANKKGRRECGALYFVELRKANTKPSRAHYSSQLLSSVAALNNLSALVLNSRCVVSQHVVGQNAVGVGDGCEPNYWQTQERAIVGFQYAIASISQA